MGTLLPRTIVHRNKDPSPFFRHPHCFLLPSPVFFFPFPPRPFETLDFSCMDNSA